jgi:hypothetical protein
MTVTIDSGDFPLIRNIDHTRQPECSQVFSKWLRIFKDDVPTAMSHLDDVIEDVIRYELWTKVTRGGPTVLFEHLGLMDLDLESAVKTLKRLRKDSTGKKAQQATRRAVAKELQAAGLTQQQIAAKLGVSTKTVQRDVDRNGVATPKVSTPPRKDDRLRFGLGTTPETAAGKLADKFGDEWCRELCHVMVSRLVHSKGTSDEGD